MRNAAQQLLNCALHRAQEKHPETSPLPLVPVISDALIAALAQMETTEARHGQGNTRPARRV